jgi:hypothetical protein
VEAAYLADLGDEHRTQDRSYPGDGLDGSVTPVSAQPATGQVREHLDLEVQGLDHPAGRVNPGSKRRRQLHPVQQLLPTGTEQIAHRHRHPAAGEHRMDLAFHAGAQRHQLGPVAHQLPQLPNRRRGDPRLRQPAHPQEIRQIRSVPLIIFDPPVGKHLHSQRMRQMHLRTQLGQRVGRPIPPIRRFQHHLRCLPRPGHHRPQILRVIRDPHRLQMLTRLSHPHQHRPTPMEINPNNLLTLVGFAHRGLLKS